MVNQLPPVTRNVSVYVHDGVEWRKLKSDSEGRLLVAGQQLTSYINRFVKGNLSVGPGETYTILDTTSGRGRIIHSYLRVDGQSASSFWSGIKFYTDGTPSTTITPDLIYHAFVGKRVVDISLAGVITWDTTNHIYEIWFDIGPTFNSSLKITLYNGDSANAITVNYGVWVEWWV